MKKNMLYMFFVVLFILGLYCSAVNVCAAEEVRLVVNNEEVACDVPPVIINDRTLVPVRVLFEHLNAQVTWNDALKQAVVTSGDSVMVFTVNSNIAYLNGGMVYLDAAPVIENGRTLVPVRFVSENLGYTVEWNGTRRTVYVSNSGISNTESVYASSANISSVDVRQGNEKLVITVNVTSKINPEIMALTNPDRLVFDLRGASQQCKDGKQRNVDYPVKEVRWAKHDDYSRIVIESEEALNYSWEYISSDKLEITVSTVELPDNIQQPSTDEEYVVPEVNVSGAPTVVIDAGHGGRDSGAVGRNSNGDIVLMEKSVCLDIARKVTGLLTANGINVIMTRTEDVALGDTTMDDLLKRCEIANNSDACLFVSIHNNAFTDSEASGTCVLYAGLSTNENYGITGKQLAQNILTPLLDAVGLQNRGLVESPNIVVLKRTAMPAALIECAFITCEKDRAILGSEDKRNDMAQAIYNGIITSLRQMGQIN